MIIYTETVEVVFKKRYYLFLTGFSNPNLVLFMYDNKNNLNTWKTHFERTRQKLLVPLTEV